jgi:phosphoglycolate phosphatase-like HAD superfamily hydrolase
MVRLVLFDIDGTLLHTNAVGIRAFTRTLESEFNVPNGTEGLKFAGRTDTGLVRELFVKHGIEPSKKNFQRFFDAYAKWLAPMLAESGGEVCPGAWSLIRELQAMPNAPVLGLLTGNIRLGAEIKLRHFDLWNVFVTGAFADDSEDRNQIAAIALQRGGAFVRETLRGDQAVVIGDTPLDIACGRAIGAKVLAVATGVSPLAELESLKPEWAVSDLTKIGAKDICG